MRVIRRRDPDGYVLVSHAEQAKLAALLAASVGEEFAQPAHPDALQTALQLQSIGFEVLELQWPLDSAGRPADLYDLPLSTLAKAWQAPVDRASSIDLRVEMLCSILTLRHCDAAAKHRRGVRDTFELNRVQQREIERQEHLRPQLNLRNDVPMLLGLPEESIQLTEPETLFNYDVRLALLLEQVAAHVCALRAPAVLPAVRPHPTGKRATVSLRLHESNSIVLDPFPFAEPLEFIVAGRFVSDRIYDHERELHHELEHAPERRLRVRIRA